MILIRLVSLAVFLFIFSSHSFANVVQCDSPSGKRVYLSLFRYMNSKIGIETEATRDTASALKLFSARLTSTDGKSVLSDDSAFRRILSSDKAITFEVSDDEELLTQQSQNHYDIKVGAGCALIEGFRYYINTGRFVVHRNVLKDLTSAEVASIYVLKAAESAGATNTDDYRYFYLTTMKDIETRALDYYLHLMAGYYQESFGASSVMFNYSKFAQDTLKSELIFAREGLIAKKVFFNYHSYFYPSEVHGEFYPKDRSDSDGKIDVLEFDRLQNGNYYLKKIRFVDAFNPSEPFSFLGHRFQLDSKAVGFKSLEFHPNGELRRYDFGYAPSTTVLRYDDRELPLCSSSLVVDVLDSSGIQKVGCYTTPRRIQVGSIDLDVVEFRNYGSGTDFEYVIVNKKLLDIENPEGARFKATSYLYEGELKIEPDKYTSFVHLKYALDKNTILDTDDFVVRYDLNLKRMNSLRFKRFKLDKNLKISYKGYSQLIPESSLISNTSGYYSWDLSQILNQSNGYYLDTQAEMRIKFSKDAVFKIGLRNLKKNEEMKFKSGDQISLKSYSVELESNQSVEGVRVRKTLIDRRGRDDIFYHVRQNFRPCSSDKAMTIFFDFDHDRHVTVDYTEKACKFKL